MKELLLLKLGNAIATKGWITAKANFDTVWYEEWKVDWDKPMAEADNEICDLISKLEALMEGQE
jgi:hypothetical protein